MSAISAELALEIKDFLAGIKKAQSSASGFAKSGTSGTGGWQSALSGVAGGIATVAKGAAIAGAAIVAVGGAIVASLAAGIKSALDMGGQFSDIAAQVGSTAGEVRVLSAAFENNGMGRAEIPKTVNKMSKAINDAINGLSTSRRAFSEIGLDPAELIKDDPIKAFNKIMAAMDGITNESKRVAVSMDIFGRGGGKLGVLLKDKKAMDNARRMIGGQADILDEHAEQFDRASDVLNQMGTKVQGFFVGVGAQIIEQILPAIEYINDIDLTAVGKRFGDALATALDYAKAIYQTFQAMPLGDVAALFSTLLSLGIKESINVLVRGVSGSAAAFVSIMLSGIVASLATLSIIASAGFWEGMKNALLGIGYLFTGVILNGIAAGITAMKSATGKLGGVMFGDKDKEINKLGDTAQKLGSTTMELAGYNLAPTTEKLGKVVSDATRRAADSFGKAFNESANLINTDGEKSAVDGLVQKIKQVADTLAKERKGNAKVKGPADSAEGASTGGLPAINGRLAKAMNVLSGRSANAVIAASAAQTAANTEEANGHLKTIADNTGKKPQAPASLAMMGGGRFA